MTNRKLHIKNIDAEDTFAVRHPVLRKGRPMESCAFMGDDLESTFHLGLYLNEELIGVATFLNNRNKMFKEPFQYQLRGMAVLESQQGQQFGNRLLNHGEDLLRQMQVDRLWFNARITAADFYTKQGYNIIGDVFEIADVGPHYIMSKAL